MSMTDLSDKERMLAERFDTRTAGDLTISESAGGLVFLNAEQVMNFSKMMALSQAGVRKHLRGNVGACLAVCVQAIEWGMSPYAVANKSYLVNDQLAFESQLVQAVILKRAPIKGRFTFEFSGDGQKRKCRVSAELKDTAQVVEYESPEIGKITPQNSPLWKSDPDQQLAYFSGRALCRRHFPDVLLGVYSEDEFEPHVGPDSARDITPPRGLASKLDALAGIAPANDYDDALDVGGTDGNDPTAATSSAQQEHGAEADEAAAAQTQPDSESKAPDPILLARRRGAEDRNHGMQRRAVPTEYRTEARTAEANAWRYGFDNSEDLLADT